MLDQLGVGGIFAGFAFHMGRPQVGIVIGAAKVKGAGMLDKPFVPVGYDLDMADAALPVAGQEYLDAPLLAHGATGCWGYILDIHRCDAPYFRVTSQDWYRDSSLNQWSCDAEFSAQSRAAREDTPQ